MVKSPKPKETESFLLRAEGNSGCLDPRGAGKRSCKVISRPGSGSLGCIVEVLGLYPDDRGALKALSSFKTWIRHGL